jgi:hypothetical protein
MASDTRNIPQVPGPNGSYPASVQQVSGKANRPAASAHGAMPTAAIAPRTIRCVAIGGHGNIGRDQHRQSALMFAATTHTTATESAMRESRKRDPSCSNVLMESFFARAVR